MRAHTLERCLACEAVVNRAIWLRRPLALSTLCIALIEFSIAA